MTTLKALPLVLIGAAIWFLLAAAVTDKKLSLAVESGRMSFEPAFIRLRIRVEPDAANRALAVGIVGAEFETSSLEQLAGAGAPKTRWREFKGVPAGEYQAVASVQRADGSQTTVTDRLIVLGRY
jgi:hypothetical protein